jgi:hypothetical protein
VDFIEPSEEATVEEKMSTVKNFATAGAAIATLIGIYLWRNN